jgi:hypothetical protein
LFQCQMDCCTATSFFSSPSQGCQAEESRALASQEEDLRVEPNNLQVTAVFVLKF